MTPNDKNQLVQDSLESLPTNPSAANAGGNGDLPKLKSLGAQLSQANSADEALGIIDQINSLAPSLQPSPAPGAPEMA